MIDRISNLPDQVAHNILAFLNIKDLTSFGCVSKRCRELYLSTPSLDFEGVSYMSRCEERLKFMSSLDRFLFIHRTVNKIHRFRISWCNLSTRENPYFAEDIWFRVITWIHNAVRCKVEVLEVDVFAIGGRHFSLPSSVFLCGSLKSLLMNHCQIRKAPSLASSSNLEYLKLRNLIIEDEGFFKWISCSCKCIKELHLRGVNGIKQVTIESSSLKSFGFVAIMRNCDLILSISGEKLEDILIDWDGYSTCKNFLNIFAPNLKYLKCSVDAPFQQVICGKISSLEKAEFFLMPDFKIWSEVLCSINRVEALVLNKETTMALFNGVFTPGLLANVCYLTIHIGSFLDILVPEMVSIFGRMCNLSTLEIKSDPEFLDLKTYCSGFNMGYWRLQNIPFIDQLKEVTIELSNGSNGIQFAKYVLECAQNLKKLTVFHSPHQLKAERKIRKSMMTSSAEVVILEDQERGI